MISNRSNLIQQLFQTLHATLPYYDQPDDVLNRSYDQGKWTMREILVHLSDQEAVYLDRSRRVAAEDNPTLMNMNENLWANNLHYSMRNLTLARLQFESARRSTIEMLQLLDESVDLRAGTHSTAGRKTFADLVASRIEHTAHHLEQIKAIIEGRTWTPSLNP